MIKKNQINFDKIKKLYYENYHYFLKNILLQAYKIKTLYDLKSMKNINNDSLHVSLNTSVKDIFNYQSKKISTDFFLQCSNERKYPSSFFLDEKKYTKVQEEVANDIIKLNNSSEENLNILFRIENPYEEKMEVKFCKNPKNEKETFLQLWTTSSLVNSIKLEEKGIKSVYFDDVFGKPKFSPDGQKLIFLAELDSSKNFKNYFSIDNQKYNKENLEENSELENDEFLKNMKKFEYKQEFGEAMDGKSNPIIAIYDIIKNDIGLIDLYDINKNLKNEEKEIKIYPAFPFFDNSNKDIIFTGYDFKNDNKLGIIFCLKRPSKIYLLKSPKINWKNDEKKDKKFDKNNEEKDKSNEENKFNFDNKLFVISNEIIEHVNKDIIELNKNYLKIDYNETIYNYTNIYPSLSPDGNRLMFFSNEKATAHMNGLRLNLIEWSEEKKKLEEFLKNDKEIQEKYNEKNELSILNLPNFKFHVKLILDKITFDNNYFCGIYSYEPSITKSFFISNDKIIINTNHENSNKFYLYDISKNILILPYQSLNIEIFDSKSVINSENKLFFSLNSYVNILPFVCMWKINEEKYDSIIDNIIKEEDIAQVKLNINSLNYQNFLDNNKLIKNDHLIFDKIVNLETENFNFTKKNLKVIYLSDNFTNDIFHIRQIENENFEYFSKNDGEEANLFNFNNFNIYDFDKYFANDKTCNAHVRSKEDFLLQNTFKQYINFIIKNTKVDDYKLNNVYGHFIYSESIYFKEISESLNCKKNFKRPIVYFLHGGPNANLPKKFLIIQSIFLSHGYGVLVINYPGSNGYGQSYLKSLNGNIGNLDVEACGEFLKNFIIENKDKYNLEESKTIIYGGSHGGFLGAWLICDNRYKNLFSSAVLRNPVTDLNCSMACTDIPDWVFGQATDLDVDNNYPPTKEIYNMFFDKSPVYKTSNAITPTLIKLGRQDKRVSHFNGLYFYQALKHNKCKTRLHLYPEDCHPLALDETDIDSNFSDLVWMNNNLN